MLHRISRSFVLCAISLIASVISLTATSLAATAPVVTNLNPVSQGLRSPVKIVIDTVGNYYVADQRVGVIKYNPYGVPVLTIKTAGTPMGVAVAQNGNLLVSQLTFVASYDTTNGSEVSRFTGQLKAANSLTVDSVTGYIYVADGSADEIQVYTADGQFSSRIGTGYRGTGQVLPLGKLSMPSGVAFEKVSGQLAVADTLNGRIQFFNTNGDFVKAIGVTCPGVVCNAALPMQFVMPRGVAFDYDYSTDPPAVRMYVLDIYQNNVQVVDPSGTGSVLLSADSYVGTFGTGNTILKVPTDLAFDHVNKRLMVVNGSGVISMFGIDGGTSPLNVEPPVLGIDPVQPTIYAPNLTLSGSVTSGAIVTVTSSSNTAVVGTVAYPTPTTWTCLVSNIPAGLNVISASARGTNGVESQIQTVSVDYVLAAPAFTVSSAPAVTNAALLALEGTVDAGSTLQIKNNVTGSVTAATVTATTWNASVSLSEGLNTLSLSAQKPSSATANKTVEVVLDSVPPSLSVSALPTNSHTSTQVQNITGSVSDVSAVSVIVNNTPVTLTGGTFSVPLTLAEGINEIVIIAADALGNTTTDARTVYFDSTRPVITVRSPMDNSFTNAAFIGISGQVDMASTVTINGTPAVVSTDNSWIGNLNLATGVNTIDIVATDANGNFSSVKRTITLDTANPVVAITTPSQDSALNAASVTVAGTISDNSTVIATATLNGVVVPVVITDGAFETKIVFPAEGIYALLVSVTDPAGNVTHATRNLIYDSTPPLLTVNKPANSSSDIFKGTVEAGAQVVLKSRGKVVGKVVVSGKKWQANLARVAYDKRNISVVATDAAGNVTEKSLINSNNSDRDNDDNKKDKDSDHDNDDNQKERD